MDFFDLVNISERYMEWINPTSPEKLLKAAEVMALQPEKRVVDYGCGFGSLLALWGEKFGISGIGIDLRPYACQRARDTLSAHDLQTQVQIVCENGATYQLDEPEYDVAVCLGATFIWGGFPMAIREMKKSIHQKGTVVIGEVYWTTQNVPQEYREEEPSIFTEDELLSMIRGEGYELQYVLRSNHDEWDRYMSDNWYGLLNWLEKNKDHPDRQEVVDHLHQSQDRYMKYGREYMGWAIYLLKPAD